MTITAAARARVSPIHLITPRFAMNQYPPTTTAAAPSRAVTVRVMPVSPSSAMMTTIAATSAAHAALASQRRLAGIDGEVFCCAVSVLTAPPGRLTPPAPATGTGCGVVSPARDRLAGKGSGITAWSGVPPRSASIARVRSAASHSFDCGHSAGADGRDECLVVQVVLVGVALGEVGDGPVERVVGAEVVGDGDRVTGAGVGAGQGPPAQARIELQSGGGHGVHERGGLHVPQLPPVVVPVLLDALGPAQVDVAGGLHHPLSLDDPFPRVAVAALGQVVLQDRPGGLLHLQEQRVLRVAALLQHDERPGADAADADDLAGHVDDLEAFQQVPPVVLQRGPVLPELLVHGRLDLFGGQPPARGEVPGGHHPWGL